MLGMRRARQRPPAASSIAPCTWRDQCQWRGRVAISCHATLRGRNGLLESRQVVEERSRGSGLAASWPLRLPSQHGTTARFHQVVGYVRAEQATNAELHVKGAGHRENSTICWHGRTRRNHRGRDCRRARGSLSGHDLQPPGRRRQAHQRSSATPLAFGSATRRGPTGYVLYWQLTRLGVHCDVTAPSLVPKMAGDRIKTDRRDGSSSRAPIAAATSAPVWVPDAHHESRRDLVRAREAGKEDKRRARHRLGKYLLRYGQRPGDGCRAWTAASWQWVRHLKLPHAEQTSSCSTTSWRSIIKASASNASKRLSTAPSRLRLPIRKPRRRPPISARRRQDHRHYPRHRVWHVPSFRARQRSHELHGPRALRAFERKQAPHRRDHQNRELAPAPCAGRVRLATAIVSTSGTSVALPMPRRAGGKTGGETVQRSTAPRGSRGA
jgi:hypothetical protein